MLPYALAGRDVIGCAETGTGKTAAYLLPILARLIRENREGQAARPHDATRALILAPTRELATQIDDEIQGFAYHAPVASVAVYGGVPMEPQERALKAGVDIVVATPGRLLDHMRSNVGDFSKLEVFVLDEADRMMDMGFWPDVRRIAEAMPPSATRQTMLFSATMPEEVMRFADALAPDAVFVQVGSRTRSGADDLARGAHPAGAREGRRSSRSTCAARTSPRSSSSTRRSAAIGWRASCSAVGPARGRDPRGSIAEGSHGRDRELPRRPDAVLVATDVAARGLDIDDVGLIVNYEVPHGLDTYVHRVGRTGRNDATGHALTLADPHERRDLEAIERAFGLKFG